MSKVKSGSYWLCHHNELLEWVWDEHERRQYIDSDKPESQRAIRQLCFQRVKGTLPQDIVSAIQAWDKECDKECDKARAKADKECDKARAKADKECDKAQAKAYKVCDKARAKAYKEWAKARAKAWAKARAKARDKAHNVIASHKTELEAQFAKECPEAAKFWNGTEIVFPEKQTGDLFGGRTNTTTVPRADRSQAPEKE